MKHLTTHRDQLHMPGCLETIILNYELVKVFGDADRNYSSFLGHAFWCSGLLSVGCWHDLLVFWLVIFVVAQLSLYRRDNFPCTAGLGDLSRSHFRNKMILASYH